MSYQYNISDIGLRLIKAYEGYSQNGQILRGGKKIVGYGRVTNDLSAKLSEKDATAQLMADLSDIENIVNTNVHAAMSQGQFDALCSLAYSIGVDAFLNSEVLHAMNRGEIITAANGFDGWRLGKIDEKVYVVDALVRRRTAEKALFLRPHRTVPAPHQALQAIKDDTVTPEQIAQTSETSATPSNIVPLYQGHETALDDIATETDDAEIFELTNRVEDDTVTIHQSPIAEAAAEVSDRLDALMETDATPDESWPESLVEEEEVFEPAMISRDMDVETDLQDSRYDIVQDPVDETDYYVANGTKGDDGKYASADKFIEPGHSSDAKQNFWTFVTMIILGLTMAGGGLWARVTGNLYFGDLSRLTWSAIFALGFLMAVMGAYYLIKHLFGKS